MADFSYTADSHTKTGLRPSRQAIKRAALALAVALGIAGAADFGYGYLTTGRYLESTDDAYVKANSTIVSPKVSGYLAEVLVGDNEQVKAGQLLARIDDRDFGTALEPGPCRCRGVRSRGQKPRCPDRAAAAADRTGKPPTSPPPKPICNSRSKNGPVTTSLMKSGSGTVQRAQQTDAALREKTAQLQQGKSGLIAANRKIDVLTTERAKAVAQLDHARAVEAAGGAEPVLHEDHRAGRRHRRRAHAAGRPIRAGRHAADGGGAARCGLCGGEFQGDPAHPCAQRPAGRNARSTVSTAPG